MHSKACMHAFKSMHAYIRTYIHKYIHKHTYMHTVMHTLITHYIRAVGLACICITDKPTVITRAHYKYIYSGL